MKISNRVPYASTFLLPLLPQAFPVQVGTICPDRPLLRDFHCTQNKYLRIFASFPSFPRSNFFIALANETVNNKLSISPLPYAELQVGIPHVFFYIL